MSEDRNNDVIINTSLLMLKKIEDDLNKMKKTRKQNDVIEYYLATKKRSNYFNWTTKIAMLSTFLLISTIFGIYMYLKLGYLTVTV